MEDNNTRKILYSPGYGAGWSSWASGELAKYMVTHAGIIEAVEALGPHDHLTSSHPAVVKFMDECTECFGEVPYLGGMSYLKVMEVEGRFRITEYDGWESVETEQNMDWM